MPEASGIIVMVVGVDYYLELYYNAGGQEYGGEDTGS